METDLSRIDSAIPRFNQACTAVATATAFVLGFWPIVAVVAAILLVSRFAGPRYALFTRIYTRWIRPRRDSPVVLEPAGPPRFAQLVGAAVLGVATVCFVVGLSVVGWAVTLAVTVMASLAAATRVCVACRIYEVTSG